MKNRTCKIISLVLSLVMIFTNCEYVFAAKGDPLQEHKEYFDLIRKEFENTENASGNSTYPAMWKHEPNYRFWLWTDDYRTVVVYNIPYLMGYESNEKGNFVQATAKALIKSRKAASRAEELAKKCAVKTTEEFIKIFKDEYKKELTSDSNLISALAKFLGEPDVERGIQLYKTLFPSLIKSIPIKRLDPPWDQSGLYVLAEYLMVKIRSTCKSKKNLPYRLDDDDAAYERLVSDFTNYLKVYNIIK